MKLTAVKKKNSDTEFKLEKNLEINEVLDELSSNGLIPSPC